MITFTDLAKDVAIKVWGFHPNRQIRPVHFANGFVRALAGTRGSPDLLQKVAAGYRRGKVGTTNQQLVEDLRDQFEWKDESLAADSVAELRSALDLVLNQDKAFFPSGFQWSMTLTHPALATSDPSDQGTGKFVAELLAASKDETILETLRTTLIRPNDNIWILTSPLLRETDLGLPPVPSSDLIKRLAVSPHLLKLQHAFSTLCQHGPLLEKTMFLQRAVTLGAFGLFLQLVRLRKLGTDYPEPIPILICPPSPSPEVREASRSSFVRCRQSTEVAFEIGLKQEMKDSNQDQLSRSEYRELAHDWLPDLEQNSKDRPKAQQVWNRFLEDFEGFGLGTDVPFEAFLRAAVRAAFVAMRLTGGEDPEGAARGIARTIGLLYPRKGGSGERYFLPSPQFLDTLVVSLLEPGEDIPVEEFWDRAYDHFGIICGAHGTTDAQRLAAWGIRKLTPTHLTENAKDILGELVRMGHATEYPDDIAMIRAGGGQS